MSTCHWGFEGVCGKNILFTVIQVILYIILGTFFFLPSGVLLKGSYIMEIVIYKSIAPKEELLLGYVLRYKIHIKKRKQMGQSKAALPCCSCWVLYIAVRPSVSSCSRMHCRWTRGPRSTVCAGIGSFEPLLGRSTQR